MAKLTADVASSVDALNTVGPIALSLRWFVVTSETHTIFLPATGPEVKVLVR